MLYSPIPDPSESAVERAKDLGSVEAILAPSHFHHLGIPDWLSHFPEAHLYAPDVSIPRLQRQRGLEFLPMSNILECLPDSVRIVEAEGVKAGEAWLITQDQQPALAVCDAFACAAKPDGDPTNPPKQRGAFKTMCVGDLAAYQAWATRTLRELKPQRLLPAHGGSSQADRLWQDLTRLVEEL